MGKVGNFFKTITKPGVKLIQRLGQTKPGHRISDWKVFNWLSRHNAVRDGSGNLEYETIPGKAPKTWVKQVTKTGKAAKNAEVAQHVTSGVGEVAAIGLIGLAVFEIVQAIVAQAPIEANVQAAQADLELYKDVAALYETVYAESGLYGILNDAMLESDYDMWTNLQYVNSISIAQNEDKSGVLLFNVVASNDKEGDLCHTYDVKFNISEDEYNKLIAAYNPEQMYEVLSSTENQAKLNSLDMFKIFDLKSLKGSIDLISQTIDEKDCDITLKDFNAITLEQSKDKNAFISPVVDKYYNALVGAGALLTDNYNETVEKLLTDAKPIKGKSVEHYYTYEMNEDGTFNVSVYAQVAHHAPLQCNLKVSNTSVLFNETMLSDVISNYFKGVEQDIVVEFANAENEINNFGLLNSNSQYVWYVLDNIATMSESTFVELVADSHNVTIYKNAETGEYVVVQKQAENAVSSDNSDTNTDEKDVENKEDVAIDTETSVNTGNANNEETEEVIEEEITSDITVE